jgi:pyruvate dehydrogenase E2 component (dihydrolipoamide acetyltransferase)
LTFDEGGSVGKAFKLPDLGENIEAAEVVRVLVAEGDRVEAEQAVLEMETEKAMFEVPCPFAGRVEKVHVKPGDRVPAGAVLLTVEETDGVGMKPAAETAVRGQGPGGGDQAPPAPGPRPPVPPEVAVLSPAPRAEAPPAQEETGAPAPAGPATRRLARELGVDLRRVQGSEPGGRVTAEDVQAYVREAMSGAAAGPGVEAPALPDFSRWGQVERQPLRSVRRKTAEHVGLAWRLIPHVTQFDRADVTELEALRKRHTAEAEAMGGKLTPTAFVIKAVVTALKAFPQFNASLDAQAEELVLKRYYHIGLAVDTERGLLVPVLRDADRKGVFELAKELVDLAERTRQGKVGLEDLQGGTFTITNLGTIGGTAFTPIVNHPEVAILGVARSREEAVVRNGRVEPRLIMPLCLSYDHRVVDGADGARFARRVAESLENPEKLLLGG